MDKLLNFIKENNIGKCLQNESLKKYTTYKVGGIAKYIVTPKDTKKLIKLIKYLKDHEIKFKVLGKGSNTLFSSDVYNGVIIKLDEFNNIEINNNKIKVGSGVNLVKLSLIAARKSLTGLEFASGIPGTVGGAIYMNAGAYNTDFGYITQKVKVLTPDYKVISMTNKELNFHYRDSFFQHHKGYICLEANLKLAQGKKTEIMKVIEERRKRRIESQPLEYPSAGSVFRNPKGMFAGKLIEDLGLKGLKKGGAQISNKHANFIINTGDATAEDIKDLIDFVGETVEEKYNIKLHVEQEFVNWSK
ncbi:MAG: UDP-N-acetylmuramate dehydrogenase [bacterium]|nr:UDP-N-acetylmuramate dehydrogenase [bacterium]